MVEIDELKKLQAENAELRHKLKLLMEILSESELLKERPLSSMPDWIV